MPPLYMKKNKNCKNCNAKIRMGSWCSARECQSLRCKEYYKKTYDRRMEVGMINYYKYKNDPKSYKKIRATNIKAKNKERFGVQDVSGIKAKFNNVCAACKKPKPLIIHHIDKNGRGSANPNNEITNLLPLCRSCHAMIHLHGEELYIKNYENKSL